MKGKILGAGVIGGLDGQAYDFKMSDIANLNGKDESIIIGSNVEFEADGKQAKSVRLEASVLNDLRQFARDKSISSIKLKAYVYLICSAIFLLHDFSAFTLFVLSIITLIFAFLNITAVTGYALLKPFLLSLAIGIVGGLLGYGLILYSFFTGGAAGTTMFVFGVIILIATLVGVIYFSYVYYNNLKKATDEPLFLYSFITKMVGLALGLLLMFVPFIGSFFLENILLIAFIMEFIAWFKFKELRAAPQKAA